MGALPHFLATGQLPYLDATLPRTDHETAHALADFISANNFWDGVLRGRSESLANGPPAEAFPLAPTRPSG